MSRVRAALYLDFDNVFGGLLKLDPAAAVDFAENPGTWLDRLSTALTVDGPRTWLVLRCYMNPSGSVPDPGEGNGRLYFSRFRPYFTGAGFDVVDCPPITHTKNAADIRLVLDAVDALGSSTTYDEFVIASGDSDMTPLLVRLRAADRRTTIVSPSDAADAFTAVADRLVNGQQVLELVQGEEPDLDEEAPKSSPTRAPVPPLATAGDEGAFERFRKIVNAKYAAASAPLHMSTLAQEVRAELGGEVDDSQWFGHGMFRRALEALELPQVRMSDHLVWHASRHQVSGVAASFANGVRLPAPVARLTALLNLPRLPTESWVPVYEALASTAGSGDSFNLADVTRSARDQLVERGVQVNRQAVGFVSRGALHGGVPLYREPTPDAAEIGAAFVANVLSRATAASIELTEAEVEAVRSWLGVPSATAI